MSKLDQILDDFYDAVFLTEQPKAKQAIKDLVLGILSEEVIKGGPDINVRFLKRIHEL